GDEAVAVRLLPLDGDEEPARLHLPRVVRHVQDARLGIPLKLRAHGPRQLAERHYSFSLQESPLLRPRIFISRKTSAVIIIAPAVSATSREKPRPCTRLSRQSASHSSSSAPSPRPSLLPPPPPPCKEGGRRPCPRPRTTFSSEAAASWMAPAAAPSKRTWPCAATASCASARFPPTRARSGRLTP